MANKNFILVDSVDVYNKAFGLDTLHPLVSVVDFSSSARRASPPSDISRTRSSTYQSSTSLTLRSQSIKWPTVSVSNTPSTLLACSRRWWVSHRVNTDSSISIIN